MRNIALEKVKCRLMEYLAVVQLLALVAQEADIDHAEAQEVTLKKAIDEPASGANDSKNGHRALIKVDKILAPWGVPVPPSHKAH